MTTQEMARSFLRRVAAILREAERLFEVPPHLAAEIDLLVSASRRLREERELAFYGDEETETEAEALISREDAEDALRTARRVVELCTAGRRGVKRPS